MSRFNKHNSALPQNQVSKHKRVQAAPEESFYTLRTHLINEDGKDIRIFKDNVEVGDFGHFIGAIHTNVKIGEKVSNKDMSIEFQVVDIINTIRSSKGGVIDKFIVLRQVKGV